MDLSLTGSQINLATRFKPTTPTVQYPVATPSLNTTTNSRRQFRSPSVNSNRSWHSSSATPFKGRPASADLGQLNRTRKSSFRNSVEDVKQPQSSSSSSHILRFLLSETINRQRDPVDSPQSMAESQSEEECPEQIEIEDEEEEQQPKALPPATNTRFSQLRKSSNQLSPVVKPVAKAWTIKQPPKNVAKGLPEPDLPGRVSFSTNVFEIDFSDLSDDSRFDVPMNEKSQNGQKFVHFAEQNNINPKTDPEDLETSEMDYSQKSDTSSKIIEDYKKEIESLNRRHEQEMTKLNTEQRDVLFFNNNNLVLPGVDTVDSAKNSVVDNYLETIKETESLEVFEQLESEILANEDEPGVSAKGSHLERTVTSTWDNSQRSDERMCSSSSDEKPEEENGNHKPEVTIEVKKDVEKPRITFNVKKNPIQKPTPCVSKNLLRKPKPTQNTRFAPVKTQHGPEPKLRKAKSVSNLKEENHLQNFQIDKVDSWMSINKEQEADSMRTLMLMKRPRSSHVQYNREWRDTPSSKTDDEGNFSLEEANDCFSNESTTYDELVSIIKEIEADKKKTDDRKNLQADVEFKLKSELSEAEIRKTEPTSDPVQKILNFLDDVESNCDRAIQRVHTMDSDRDDFQFAIEPDVMGSVPKMEDLLMLPNRHLARRVIAMYLRTNELSNAVQLAKENMKSVREEKIKAVRGEKLQAQKSLSDQKRHFENIVGRHQTFVEQLLKDKSSLCEKVTGLSRRVESQNQAWEHKLEAEIARTRDAVMASEKIRRERWIKENTKKIRELTVKGLEHEINRMTEQHKQDMADLKRQHQEEMHEKLDEARGKFEAMEKGIRETCAEDREAVIEKERNAIRDRYERQLITEQNSFEEQKVRMTLEWNSERERLMAEIKVKEKEFEARKDSMAADRNDMLDQLRLEHKEKTRQMIDHHRNEINSIRDQFEKDFTIWKSEFESAQKLREIERENNIRTECRKERDAQIDNIVAKIDSEAQRHQQEYDLKLRRMKDKFEIDIKELEVAESRSREKYLETRHRLAECDGTMQNMQTTIKQLEIELSHSKKLCNEFIVEKDTIHERAREEIRSEMDAKRKEHEDEIQRIYSRVQKAIQKKDATLEVLQGDNTILKERCLKLETIIRQQRKDYCTK